MTRIPQVSGPRLIRARESLGFYVKRQTGGHDVVMHRQDASRRAIIPVHGKKPVRLGTLRAILDGLRLTIEEIKEKLT